MIFRFCNFLKNFYARKNSPSVLAIVNHYYGKSRGFVGKSSIQDANTRRDLVNKAINELKTITNIDIKVCGIKNFSLVDIDIDFSHIVDPSFLIYETIEWMSRQVDKYDYFINMEDDILLKKETFERILNFDKTNTVRECFHPNRMETRNGKKYCVDLIAMTGWTDKSKKYNGIELKVALNPHSGIAILSKEKLQYAKKHVNFKKREKIIGHYMESAFANLHAPFQLFRSFSDISFHEIFHLDNWDPDANKPQ